MPACTCPSGLGRHHRGIGDKGQFKGRVVDKHAAVIGRNDKRHVRDAVHDDLQHLVGIAVEGAGVDFDLEDAFRFLVDLVEDRDPDLGHGKGLRRFDCGKFQRDGFSRRQGGEGEQHDHHQTDNLLHGKLLSADTD
jgi:hypothetical protein